ncbi:unnamed protein product [Bursaphelenchus xylophilus]|uniref:(pine wood nematode) hypothetical protein n=1 Tax=Bursaphelenchus xylophilus TaxID=6326 RepID=A0A1I7SA25_BURXY|nr:unnamed protein product [Bursaphelenchus xylophilus]CAG9131771.1 unnamed protein product [Bursaphelenchus xylophilus]
MYFGSYITPYLHWLNNRVQVDVKLDDAKDYTFASSTDAHYVLYYFLYATGLSYDKLIKELRGNFYNSRVMNAIRNDRGEAIRIRPPFHTEAEEVALDKCFEFITNRKASVGHERHRMIVRFFNTTNRKLDMIWVRDRDMDDSYYMSLAPKGYTDMQTFEGHCWVFRDSEDGEIYSFRGTDDMVFYPLHGTVVGHHETHNAAPLPIAVAFVKDQVKSLKKLCLKSISQHFTPDQVLSKPIPFGLMSDLLQQFINRISYKNSIKTDKTFEKPEQNEAKLVVDQLTETLKELMKQELHLDLAKFRKRKINIDEEVEAIALDDTKKTRPARETSENQ